MKEEPRHHKIELLALAQTKDYQNNGQCQKEFHFRFSTVVDFLMIHKTYSQNPLLAPFESHCTKLEMEPIGLS